MSGDRYQVTIVKYGTRQTVRSDVYLNYHLYDEPDGPIGMDYFFWLIRNPDRTIVVDTGFSAAGGGRRGRTTLFDPGAAFDALIAHRLVFDAVDLIEMIELRVRRSTYLGCLRTDRRAPYCHRYGAS